MRLKVEREEASGERFLWYDERPLRVDHHQLSGGCPICRRQCHTEVVVPKEFGRSWYYTDNSKAHKEYVFRELCERLGYFIQEHVRKEHKRDMSYTYTTNRAWDTWTSTAVTYAGVDTCSTSSTTAWTYWTSTAGTSTTATSSSGDTVWVTWVDEQLHTRQGVDDYRRRIYGEFQQSPETEAIRLERIARAEKERKEFARLAEERKAKEAARKERARQLLREVLSDAQNKDLDEKGYFDIQCISGAKYRINKGRSNNVKKVDQSGKIVETLCFHPQEQLDDYDTMCLQKMMLQFDEEGARRSASVSRH